MYLVLKTLAFVCLASNIGKQNIITLHYLWRDIVFHLMKNSQVHFVFTIAHIKIVGVF